MTELEDFRHRKDIYLKSHPQSPLTPEQRMTFTQLNYFPENPALKLTVALTPDPQQPSVEMITSTGSVRSYRRIGHFTFQAGGQENRLHVYQDEEGGEYFLPFLDATSGHESYGSGRYVELEPLAGGEFLVDFNMAYNPYCAYNEFWTCPIPPEENRVDARIEAGEKAFH